MIFVFYIPSCNNEETIVAIFPAPPPPHNTLFRLVETIKIFHIAWRYMWLFNQTVLYWKHFSRFPTVLQKKRKKLINRPRMPLCWVWFRKIWNLAGLPNFFRNCHSTVTICRTEMNEITRISDRPMSTPATRGSF